MDFAPDRAQTMWIKKMERVCESAIIPSSPEVDTEKFIPRENFQALVRDGFSGLTISEEFGGAQERTTTGVMVGELLSKACPSTYFAFLSHAWRVGPTLERFGTSQQKSTYLPKLASGQLQGGWALTERPQGDSKVFINTVAKKNGDFYLINGVKSFVTGASLAEFFIAVVRLESIDGPLAAFVIDRKNTGVKRSERISTVGMRGAHVADLILENCQVPESALICFGDDLDKLLDFTRAQSAIGIATLGAGIIHACLDFSIERATTIKRGGKKIASFQEVHFKIAEMKTFFDAVYQITLRAAYAQDVGEDDASMLAAVAKVQAAEGAVTVAENAMQIFGADGYVRGSVVERYWRDARFLKVAGEPIDLTRRRIADKEIAKYT